MNVTRKALPQGGFKGRDGFRKPLPYQSTSSVEPGSNKISFQPLNVPGPESQWVSEYSNLGMGRPKISKNSYVKCEDDGTPISFKTVREQFVRSHQRGYSATEEGPHGIQDYDVDIRTIGYDIKEIDEKDTNWEAARFKYGKAEVPSNLGYNLKGSLSTLQRAQEFITTGFHKPTGFNSGGYNSGKHGIKASMGVVPQ